MAWQAAGVQLLLNSDPSRGLLDFVEPHLMAPAGQQTQCEGQAWGPGTAPRRRAGYRQPRRAPVPRVEHPVLWQQHRGSGTEVPRDVKKP